MLDYILKKSETGAESKKLVTVITDHLLKVTSLALPLAKPFACCNDPFFSSPGIFSSLVGMIVSSKILSFYS